MGRRARGVPTESPPFWSALYLSCFLLGGANQISFFLTFYSVDYFQWAFPAYRVEFWLAFALAAASAVGGSLAVVKPYIVSHNLSVVLCFVASALACAAIPVYVQLKLAGVVSQATGFWLLLANKFVLGFVQSYGGGSVFSFFGTKMRPWCVQGAQAGTPAAGLFVYAVHVILKGALPNAYSGFRIAGIVQFTLTAAVLLFSAVVYMWLSGFATPSRKGGRTADEARRLLDGAKEASVNTASSSTRSMELRLEQPKATVGGVMREIWSPLLHLFLFIVVFTMLYPGLFSVMHGPTTGWFVVICFGLNGLFDTIGQTMPKWYKFYKGEWVWLALLVQLLLGLWLVGICLNNPPGDVAVWQADWLAYILMALWGLNTGTGVCCTMMYMIPKVHESKQGIASTLGLSMIKLGLCVGGALGMVIDQVILPATGFFEHHKSHIVSS